VYPRLPVDDKPPAVTVTVVVSSAYHESVASRSLKSIVWRSEGGEAVRPRLRYRPETERLTSAVSSGTITTVYPDGMSLVSIPQSSLNHTA